MICTGESKASIHRDQQRDREADDCLRAWSGATRCLGEQGAATTSFDHLRLEAAPKARLGHEAQHVERILI